MVRWAMVAFLAWAAAHLGFFIVGLQGQTDGWTTFGFLLGAAGLSLAAFSEPSDAPGRFLSGILVAFAGLVPWYLSQFGFNPRLDWYLAATLSYMGAFALMGSAGVMHVREVGGEAARTRLVRAGGVLGAVSGVIWILNDGFDSAWQPGNLLEFLGATGVAAFHRA